MRKVLALIAVVALTTIASCGTSYRPLGEVSNFSGSGGYGEKELGNGVYKLTFLAEYYTKTKKVEEYWHRRAKELCPKGYTVVNEQYDNIDIIKFVPDFTRLPLDLKPAPDEMPRKVGIIVCDDAVEHNTVVE